MITPLGDGPPTRVSFKKPDQARSHPKQEKKNEKGNSGLINETPLRNFEERPKKDLTNKKNLHLWSNSHIQQSTF